MGFEHIHTRESLLNTIMHSNINNNNNNGNNTEKAFSTLALEELKRDISALLPEQAALIDLMLGRLCGCFISAHYASSFSYMVQRMRQLDRGQVIRYPDIGENNFGKSGYFKQWGV